MSKAYETEDTQQKTDIQPEFIIEDESENNRINQNFIGDDELE